MSYWRTKLAAILAISVFITMFALLRMRNWMPMAAAAFTFAAVWLALLPSRRDKEARNRPVCSEDMGEEDRAIAELDAAAEQLRGLAELAPFADKPLFEHLADLMNRLAGHHRANPDHAERTRRFRRHLVERMIGSVAGYIELARRAGPDQADRLAAISTQLEEFVPALERIDRACLENDITALEINVEVLNDQLDRRK